jgi:predicted Zn-dependent protease
MMLSWGGVSESAIQQGESPLRRMRNGEEMLSPRFSLIEDYRAVEVPRFNELGELAPEALPIFEKGQFRNSLISTRSAKEYGLKANGAAESETYRAPSLQAGALSRDQVLSQLGEGLYLSNLHYLNWSDQTAGRITGMTRYACFWVEKGQIVAPIENLRFDDALFSLFGNSLVDFTQDRSYFPDVGTYGRRQLGGIWAPGMLLSGMKFTL